MNIRVGQGVDIHPFQPGTSLVLGGVSIPHSQGLKGHSDADALSHAVCDALLGALALGDIGSHFSDRDPRNKGRSSIDFLKHASKLVSDQGYKINNIDSTILTEEPMLNPHIEEMRKNLSYALGVKMDQVSVKATRPEKLGSLGRKEGLLAMAVVLLTR